MEFIETKIFTEDITKWPDDIYRELQKRLMEDPKDGAVIKGSGGLRKIRWKVPGKGKSGGLRIIYYCLDNDRIYMIFVYPKSVQEDLTPEQVKILKTEVENFKAILKNKKYKPAKLKT